MSKESPSATESAPIIPSEELRKVWHAIEDKGLFAALLLAWAAVFYFLGNSTLGYINTPSLFHWMYTLYNAPDSDDSHGMLIPFVVPLVLWWRREELLALKRRSWAPALALLLFAAALHVFAFLIQQPRLSIVAFFVGLYALVGIVWGPAWLKNMFLPFCIFAFCVPVAGIDAMKTLTMPLQLLATSVTGWIAHSVLGFHVSSQGSKIVDDATGIVKYEVVRGCSGIRSLISLFALMSIYGIVACRSPWRRIVLALTSIPLALICNIIRLVCVIMAGEIFGGKAGDFVHEWSGFFTYALAVACMMGLSHWWAEPSAQPKETQPHD
jgi:exosortase